MSGGALALDIAWMTGWAHVSPSGDVRHGSQAIGLRESGNLDFHEHLFGFVADMMLVMKPALVVYEAPLVGPAGQDRALRLIGAAAVAALAARRYGAKAVFAAHNNTVKKFFTGNGRAEKRDTIAACRARGWEPKDDNSADALALLSYALSCKIARQLDLPEPTPAPLFQVPA